jgi:[ribosomal protein S5]-alanine N-acetyltransferase
VAMIRIRPQQVGDAKRFFEILNHKDFIYFPVSIQSIEQEKVFLRKVVQDRKEGKALGCSILYRKQVVGAVGFRFHPERRCVGEIGYFIDRAYWGRGFATKALQLLEQEVFEKHGVHRIELLTLKKNKASQRVAEKAGYQKEGISRGVILHEGKHQDAYLFARLKPEERA